jgi:hypothetical protein
VTLFNGLEPNWLATVVGVAADYHQSWHHAGGLVLYTPAQQISSPRVMTYYVRTAGPPLPEQQIRHVVRQLAPSLAAFDIATMESRMAAFAASERALAILVGAFAVLALVIALVGVYGVVSYGASLRTAEFGMRIALGATPAHITWIVLREAVLILTSGLLLAGPLTWFCLTLIRHQLNGVAVRDPAIYLVAGPCSERALFWPLFGRHAGPPASASEQPSVSTRLQTNIPKRYCFRYCVSKLYLGPGGSRKWRQLSGRATLPLA